ncbi:hypothetical protein FB560_1165 [Microbacterium saperdae]|uniref:DUF998 domain-containing protein n=1 Tax=Microbacterium saperdae TaxID=69368 RepID=A0A543BL38_9MICO|nr:hypothetical protein FB560_1165 [Microbacterium saperdae]
MNLSLTEEKSSRRGSRRSEKKSSSPDSLRVLMRGAVAAESRALAFAFVALVVGIVVGAFVFAGEPAALSGARSVGVTAAFLAGVSAGVAFATNYLRLVRSTRPRPLSIGVRWRIGVDTVALTVSAVIVVSLLTGTVFAVLQLAFRDFALDPPAAAVVTGAVAAVAAYLLTGAASQLTTRAIANLLAMLLVSGGLASMLSARNTTWWQHNFSALGSGDGFSPYTFNITLVFAGLVIITLTHHLTHDIQQLSAPDATSRIRVLRAWLITVGALFAGVGMVSVDEAEPLHIVIATTMSVAFAGLIATSTWLVPWLPRSFTFVSVIVLAAFGVVALLMWPIGYFNLTAMELLSSILLLTWLLLFVRAIAATADDDQPGGLMSD